jgi:hypothetical protein
MRGDAEVKPPPRSRMMTPVCWRVDRGYGTDRAAEQSSDDPERDDDLVGVGVEKIIT